MNGDKSDISRLITKGLRLLSRSELNIKDENGRVILPIAYELHEPLVLSLSAMATTYGIAAEAILKQEVAKNSASSMISVHFPKYEKRRDSNSSSGEAP
jgi:hypothetical protein